MPDEYDVEPQRTDRPQQVYQGPPPAPPEAPKPAGISQQEERMFGMLCHLLGLAGLVIPFGNVVGPLVMWLVKREQSSFVDDQGKEAVNFQITMTIASFVVTIVVRLAAHAMGGGFYFGYYGIGIVNLVFVLLAATAANRGERYRYPVALRLVA